MSANTDTTTTVTTVTWRTLPQAAYVLARANSPIPRRWGGDVLSLPYAALLAAVLLLTTGDQARTATREGTRGRAVLLLTPAESTGITAPTVLAFAAVGAGAGVVTLVALLLLPVAAVATALTLLAVLVLLELVPAVALAWRTRALFAADRAVRAAYPHAALLHWVSAYPRGHDLGTPLLEATVTQGRAQPIRLSTPTQRLARWYARHGFETVTTVPLPGAAGGVDHGAVMVRPPSSPRL